MKAPFNAIVLSTDVDVGSQVTPQLVLAHLAGSDLFFIEALLPLDRLQWVHIPENQKDTGSRTVVKTGTGRVAVGHLYKLLGDLEPNGRLARVLTEIEDPLHLELRNGDRKPFLIGDYVSAEIDGKTVDRVFVIDRRYLEDGNRVFIADHNDTLHIRDVEIIWSGSDYILARGLEKGERLIVSDVPAAVEGMKVRVATQ